jgi:hypothetical protein
MKAMELRRSKRNVIEEGKILTDEVALALVGVAPLPIVAVAWQFDVGGAGWAAGVFGWPWNHVDPPYTPIGYARERQPDAGMRRPQI